MLIYVSEIINFNGNDGVKSVIKFYCHEKDKFGKEHGEFILSFTNFVNYKCKCPKCSKCYKLTYQEALDKIKLINNNRYDLIKFDNYTNVHSPITFYCHEKDRFGQEHGEFKTSFEFFVNLKYGCPICKQSHMERELNFALNQKNINFKCQQTFDWLKLEAPQFIDFYIQDLNIAIECQGIQHFKKVNFFANDEKFQKNIQRDINKFIKCKENNIKLLYLIPKEKVDFSYINSIQEIYTEENTFKSVNEIIEYINKISK